MMAVVPYSSKVCITVLCVLLFRLRCATFYNPSAVNKHISSSSSSQSEFVDKDKPVKFSTSNANKHRAYDTFFHKSNAPWYQIHSVIASITVFLLYFCVLREENDIDAQIGKPLWEKIPPLQEQVLTRKINEGKQYGSDVSKLQKESEELRNKYK